MSAATTRNTLVWLHLALLAESATYQSVSLTVPAEVLEAQALLAGETVHRDGRHLWTYLERDGVSVTLHAVREPLRVVESGEVAREP